MSEPRNFLTDINAEANRLMNLGMPALACEPSDRRGRGAARRAGRWSRQAVRALVVVLALAVLAVGAASAYFMAQSQNLWDLGLRS